MFFLHVYEYVYAHNVRNTYPRAFGYLCVSECAGLCIFVYAYVNLYDQVYVFAFLYVVYVYF